jgi:hypothetical protein
VRESSVPDSKNMRTLLEQVRRATAGLDGGIERIVGRLGDGREQVAHERRGVLGAERREIDARVALAEVRPAREELRTRGDDEEDRRVDAALREVADEIERLVVGPVEILEREEDRPLARVGLEEAAQDRAADARELLFVGLERLRERRLGEAHVEVRAEEVEELGDAAIFEELGDLGAQELARGREVGLVGDAEEGAQDALDDAVRGAALVREATERARLSLAGGDAREELGDEAVLPMPAPPTIVTVSGRRFAIARARA